MAILTLGLYALLLCISILLLAYYFFDHIKSNPSLFYLKFTEMAKLTKKKMSEMGSEMVKIAKRIRKAKPNTKWTDCMKQAGKEYKRNHS